MLSASYSRDKSAAHFGLAVEGRCLHAGPQSGPRDFGGFLSRIGLGLHRFPLGLVGQLSPHPITSEEVGAILIFNFRGEILPTLTTPSSKEIGHT